jgi:Domain of unknown function (DUF3127)
LLAGFLPLYDQNDGIMAMKVEGKIHGISSTQKVSERFTKREFILEYVENPLYPQYLKFDLTQERVTQVDQFKVGDKVEVSFNLRGREWVNPEGVKVYFNTLEAWRINKSEAQSPEAAAVAAGDPFYQAAEPSAEAADDLPF